MKLVKKWMCLLLCLTLIGSCSAAALAEGNGPEKDETVYVLTGADGSVNKVIVSDWLKNPGGESSVADVTDLLELENVKGEETFSDGIWDARGRDIYYQGISEKPLPVTMEVSYQLDGQPITAGELAGKSGHVTIRFDYRNDQYELVDINGQQEKIYVPFVVLTGLLLDGASFTNVEVTNGKLINDGDHIAVVGIAFPGLQESLNIPEDSYEIPSYVEITADVEDFTLGNTLTVATNEPFSQLKLESDGSIDDLSASMGQLTSAMGQLMDGSNALAEGLETLLEKSSELAAGIEQLAAGAEALQSGAAGADAGAQALSGGVQELSDGLNALAANNDTLNVGAQQVFGSLLSTANAQLAAAGLTNIPELTVENYAQVLEGILAKLDEVHGAPLAALKQQLDGYNAFYMGLCQYTAGVSQAADGADALRDGAAQLTTGMAALSGGAAELSGGIGQLQSGVPALVDGVTQLRDGSVELSEGLRRFNEEGIRKLADAMDADLDALVVRFNAMKAVSDNYRVFTELAEGMDGQVKFIYRTDSVE